MRGVALKWWLWRSPHHPKSTWNLFTTALLWCFKPEYRAVLPIPDDCVEPDEEHEPDPEASNSTPTERLLPMDQKEAFSLKTDSLEQVDKASTFLLVHRSQPIKEVKLVVTTPLEGHSNIRTTMRDKKLVNPAPSPPPPKPSETGIFMVSNGSFLEPKLLLTPNPIAISLSKPPHADSIPASPPKPSKPPVPSSFSTPLPSDRNPLSPPPKPPDRSLTTMPSLPFTIEMLQMKNAETSRSSIPTSLSHSHPISFNHGHSKQVNLSTYGTSISRNVQTPTSLLGVAGMATHAHSYSRYYLCEHQLSIEDPLVLILHQLHHLRRLFIHWIIMQSNLDRPWKSAICVLTQWPIRLKIPDFSKAKSQLHDQLPSPNFRSPSSTKSTKCGSALAWPAVTQIYPLNASVIFHTSDQSVTHYFVREFKLDMENHNSTIIQAVFLIAPLLMRVQPSTLSKLSSFSAAKLTSFE